MVQASGIFRPFFELYAEFLGRYYRVTPVYSGMDVVAFEWDGGRVSRSARIAVVPTDEDSVVAAEGLASELRGSGFTYARAQKHTMTTQR